MVSPIDSSQTIARLAALMRQATGRGEGPGKSSAQQARPNTTAGAEASTATLRQQLRAIDPDHPRRKRALARILIETLLTDEFGEAVVNDSEFQAIVDDVLNALDGMAGVSADLDRVIGALLDTPG